MKKKRNKGLFLCAVLMAATLSPALTSCESQLLTDSEYVDAMNGVRNVEFTASLPALDGDETLTTRANAADVASQISWILLDEENTVIGSENQSSGSSDFGKGTFKLSYGTYTIICVAHNAKSACTVTDAEHISFPDGLVTDTYYNKVTLKVDENTGAQTLTMNRCVAKFELVASDEIPANAASVKITASGVGNVLNGLTGLAAAKTTINKTAIIPDGYAGRTGVTFALYAFLPGTEATSDISAVALDADSQSINDYEWVDVSLTVNRRTRYKGIFFEPMANFDSSLSFNSDWAGVDETEF